MPPEVAVLEGTPVAVVHRRAPLALRFALSFPVVITALLVLLMLLTVRSRFNDPDMWWHLKTGEIIWNTHHVPEVDTFSYTVTGKTTIRQEWLADLTIYGAWHLGGYTGMMLWLFFASSFLAIAGFYLCFSYSGNITVAFAGALLMWLFATMGLGIRPQMIGYALLTLEMVILHLGAVGSSRWLLGLPFLFCLWVNIHSSFMLGIALLGLFLACSFCNFKLGLLVAMRWPPRHQRLLIAASLASLAALAVNPIGLKLIWYPLDVMLNQHESLSLVSEWQATAFDNPRSFAMLAVACLILLIPILRRIEVRFIELLVAGMGFGFALLHERMLFVFGILAAPVLCRMLADTWDRYDSARDRMLPNAVIILLTIAIAVAVFPNSQMLAEQVDRSNPKQALAFIQRAGLTGRLLNDYNFGGYLIWAAPDRKVFIDGRADVYDVNGIMGEYSSWATLRSDTAALLDRRNIQYCLLERDAYAAKVLQLLPHWKAVYSDELSIVFVRV